jgi:diguanylate cyclase (GGDEF)-like protein
MKNKPEDENLRRSVLKRGRPLAVLSLSEGDVIESDPDIELVRGRWDGAQAMAVVMPERSLSQHYSYENDLKSLHEISFNLSLCQSVDEVCHDAVRLGRERLGFDRVGIWLVDPKDQRWKQGTWGTDEKGKLRDERGLRMERREGDLPESFYEGKVPLLFDKNTVCRNHKGQAVGRGSKIVVPLWDGRELLGELGVDDLLRHAGFSPEKREVLVLFTRVVANLISLKRAEAELKQLASTDALTGTVNRRTALIILEKSLAQCRRSGTPLTLCLADLDGLKRVNDAFGHAAGDEYIRLASGALVRAVRSSDTVGRIGGDEFLVIFPDCRHEVVMEIMERVNAELALDAERLTYRPRLSWGVSSPGELQEGEGLEHDNQDPQRCIDILLELADQRMYDNKRVKGVSRLTLPTGLNAPTFNP